MTKTETLDALGKQCSVKEMGNISGYWCVSGGRFACSHIVHFDGGNTLTSISKDIGSAESTDAANLLADFISAIAALTGDAGTANITTSTTMAKDPTTTRDMVMKNVSVSVGDKTIELQVTRPVGGGNAAINVVGITATEVLRSK